MRAIRRTGALLACAILVALGCAGVAAAKLRTPTARTAQSAQTISKAERQLRATLANDLAQAGGTDDALVVDTVTGETLFSSSPTAPRLPASVEKLYTTTTALLEFGPNATLSTSVLGSGSLGPGGVWSGTLYLRGGGDPTFGSQSFDNVMYGTGVGATVQLLAADVARAGIHQISGAIIGDDSMFDALRGTPATGYGADLEVEGELSALAYDDGFVSASETALQGDPALFAAQQFASALRGAGVKIARGTRIANGVTPAGAKLLAHEASPPISTLIQLTNTPSDNFFAETLLKDLGARFGDGGTTADGAAVVRSVIAGHFGLDPRLDDGSGLSRYDRTTAAQVVSLLEQMQSNQSFTDSLAIAGVSGTMQDEMLGTRAVDNCRGKTGTLHDVANLVGYCTARNGDRLAFAFLLNSQSDSDYGHAIEDQMGVALANYDGPPASTVAAPARTGSGAGAPI
ncbi:MAG: D-alanyl-D-alanine carboxypeptidase/D-alanyl-D-alanine-endopeptidase [Solirubrobacteraceae bacterium]